MSYQPKTGQPCDCKAGVYRDNCPKCEGTGWQIDFAAIRSRSIPKPHKPWSQWRNKKLKGIAAGWNTFDEVEPACPNCSQSLTKIEGGYRCDTCLANNAWPSLFYDEEFMRDAEAWAKRKALERLT
jgi:predicted amidophosphoribosyltransferase